MSDNFKLKCISCDAIISAKPDNTLCPACGGLLQVIYDYQAIKANFDRDALVTNRNFNMWRYSALLPIGANAALPPLAVGYSPLYHKPGFLGLPNLYLKDDGQNPTSSLKDRASAMAVVKAMEAGQQSIACSSTGNAASSLAGQAASCGLKSYIFVPSRAPKGKIAQLLIFGAKVMIVDGDYEQTFALSQAAIERFGWYNRNAAINPYLSEGKKTVALEICEQLNWQAPDYVCVSVGDGCTIAGVWQGFYDLYQIGFIDKLPRLLSVQAAGCYPINRAWREQSKLKSMPENTLADSIAVGLPRNPDKALAAIKASNGLTIEVSDEEILAAMRELGSGCGIFGEPAGVAATAGLKKAVGLGLIEKEAKIVSIITGNGLKDIQSALLAAPEPLRIKPDSSALDDIDF